MESKEKSIMVFGIAIVIAFILGLGIVVYLSNNTENTLRENIANTLQTNEDELVIEHVSHTVRRVYSKDNVHMIQHKNGEIVSIVEDKRVPDKNTNPQK